MMKNKPSNYKLSFAPLIFNFVFPIENFLKHNLNLLMHILFHPLEGGGLQNYLKTLNENSLTAAFETLKYPLFLKQGGSFKPKFALLLFINGGDLQFLKLFKTP